MESLQLLNLKYNPFKDITPTMDSRNLIWAEMEEVKSKIAKSYEECIKNNTKQIVLNWGPYGGGKTFSSYYFIKKYKNQNGIKDIYLRCPKDGAKASDEFFKSIIDYLSFEVIHNQLKELIKINGEKSIIQYLTPIAGREYAKAICLIGSSNDEIVSAMNRFLYAGLTKAELKKLDLAKDVASDADLIKLLAGILSCFIGFTNTNNGRMVIWVDEMEDLIYYSPKYYKAFSQLLRDLFDSISEGLLVFMNFTLAEGVESNIELILGGAVWSRITKRIRYKQFTIKDATAYCVQLLDYSKIDKRSIAPLNLDIIDSVITSIPLNNLTPREINKHFTSLINYAENHELKVIDQKTLNKWIKEYEENNI